MNAQFKKSSPRKVKCPQCGRLAIFSSENPWRPFCSERCRLIDLGQWADESYRIPTSSDRTSETEETIEDDSDHYQ